MFNQSKFDPKILRVEVSRIKNSAPSKKSIVTNFLKMYSLKMIQNKIAKYKIGLY